MPRKFFISTSVLILLISSSFAQQRKGILPPGRYPLNFASSVMLANEPINWDKPKRIDSVNKTIFQVVNDSLIYFKVYKGNNLLRTRTLTPANSKVINSYKPVRRSYLDFELVGIYNYSHLPRDFFIVLYYSKKRNAFVQETHLYEINRIGLVFIYMRNPDNPFKSSLNTFNLLKKSDTIYHSPPLRIELKQKI